MDLYLVSFDRRFKEAEAFSKLLGRPRGAFVDGMTALSQAGFGLPSDAILAYPSISAASAILSEMEVNALQAEPGVASIQRMRTVMGTPFAAVPRINNLALGSSKPQAWHVSLVNADHCWAVTTGKGVKVGIIDSEIDGGLTDLPIIDGRSFHPEAADWHGTDDYHGTFCASIVGCRATHPEMIGIAPECDLYALRIGKDGRGDVEYIIAAMAWAVENKLDVVSMSQWATDGASDPHEPYWEDLNRAAEECAKAGCIVIGIAGNSGSQPNPWVTNPGRCPAVVAVGGTRSDDAWWSGSSFGPDDLAEDQAVEIVAPAQDVLSMAPRGITFAGRGTSFAAPQVAGTCALLKQLQPSLTPEQLRSILKLTSRDLGPSGRDAKFGVGRLDCLAAVKALAAV